MITHSELVNDFLSMEHWFLLRTFEEVVCEDVENTGVRFLMVFQTPKFL